ncbi:MAG: hypothetical protein A2Z72_03695 [Omnitrophica bacterium RBG_13_46_9]|nr:MAG: hypothetical protein A2Z72_03695 [Omnitrophica bacterium RBG_13_46_9]
MKIQKILKKLSLLPYGLRYKLLISFSLMSIIPLLVLVYFINIFVVLDTPLSLAESSLISLFCVIIAWLGLLLAKFITERVIDLALETRIIREGNYNKKIFSDVGDEISQIGEAINFLTQKIKTNISDLKDYQDKIKETNIEIQKRTSVLSSLLQIGELISSSVKLDSVLEFTLDKMCQLYENGFAALYIHDDKEQKFILHTKHGVELASDKIEADKGILGKAISRKKHAIVDASSKFSVDEEGDLKGKYRCENLVGFPIFAEKKVVALLVLGSGIKNFTYTSDDIDIIKVFAEQISIALERNILIGRTEQLEIKDDLTELFNMSYMTKRLKDELDRSIIAQRPCSFIMVNIDNFARYSEQKGRPQAEVALKRIARVVSENSLPLGRAGRFNEDTFAVILPETNKKGALEIADNIRKKIEILELSSAGSDRVTVSGGVSENPLDGSSPEEILKAAEEALNKARQGGKNKVEG